MTLREEEFLEIEEDVLNVTAQNNSILQNLYPGLPATYLGFLSVAGIASNGLVIWFFAACPVVSQS